MNKTETDRDRRRGAVRLAPIRRPTAELQIARLLERTHALVRAGGHMALPADPNVGIEIGADHSISITSGTPRSTVTPETRLARRTKMSELLGEKSKDFR